MGSMVGPVLALVGWTFVLWFWMYATRIPAMRRARIDMDELRRTGAKMTLPPEVARVADNYNHLHEQPTVFYALALAVEVGGAVDYYQWAAVLRSVSAFESYRKVYRDVITPLRVADLLVLREDMPRSLHACMNEAYEILQRMSGGETNEAVRRAGEMHASLHFGRMDIIFANGLHEYLTDFLHRADLLGREVNRTFFHTGGQRAAA
jgi:hypothetical protein